MLAECEKKNMCSSGVHLSQYMCKKLCMTEKINFAYTAWISFELFFFLIHIQKNTKGDS